MNFERRYIYWKKMASVDTPRINYHEHNLRWWQITSAKYTRPGQISTT